MGQSGQSTQPRQDKKTPLSNDSREPASWTQGSSLVRSTPTSGMMMAKFYLLFFLSLSLSGVSITFAVDRPNILFVVSDDHGWGDLPSNWDKTEVQLPTLEALAATGIRFSNYHTVPLCGPSRACMFTGQFSTENGMWRGPGNNPLGSPAYRGIKRDVKMLSEYFSQSLF